MIPRHGSHITYHTIVKNIFALLFLLYTRLENKRDDNMLLYVLSITSVYIFVIIIFNYGETGIDFSEVELRHSIQKE